MEDSYLIPANSKKSMLILGFFTTIDLIIFGFGVAFTVAMFLIIDASKLSQMLLILTPALISTFLVLPVPYYHNILQLLTNIYRFIFGRNRYYWKGWCVSSDNVQK